MRRISPRHIVTAKTSNFKTRSKNERKMGKPVVLVIGASGNVGSATVSALSAKYASRVEIRAGTRNPDKADKLKALPGVTVVQAEQGNKEQLAGVLKGVDALYIVAPGTENRGELAARTVEAAKTAGVKHVAAVSVTGAALGNKTVFGKQFTELEQAITKSGVPYTIIRLPYFVENYFGFKDAIVGKNAIFSPVDPEKPFAAIVAGDAGKFAAKVLVEPTKHVNKTYAIYSHRNTFSDVAREFSSALGKEINYVRVPYAAAKEAFTALGFQEWQLTGLFEILKGIDAGDPIVNPPDISSPLEQVTGEKPTDLKTWVASVAGAFQ